MRSIPDGVAVSIDTMSYVLHNPAGSVAQQAVLFVLAEHADAETWGCWPSIARVATMTALSERSVHHQITHLRKAERIRIEAVAGRTNRYVVLRTSCTPAPVAPLNQVHHTPEPVSPPPLNVLQGGVHVLHPNRHEPSGEPSREPPLDGVVEIERRVRGQLPAGADTRMTAAFAEYRMTKGVDVRLEPFIRQVLAMEAKGVPLTAVLAWFKANPGSHVHDAYNALVVPPARPAPAKPRDFLDDELDRHRREAEARRNGGNA